ncbi:response regulator transcription factor [Massilia sp. CMS3.1]|uniref:response regulator transcription factor n=1 Tax=Massilia sp. CMS3.1 TaxID=3373083 RepID=UPI003EE4A2D2
MVAAKSGIWDFVFNLSTCRCSLKASDHMVYLIDDDPSVVEVLNYLLSSSGFNAISYRTASAYLAGDRPKVPSCIVLDIRLPDVDGLEFQQKLGEIDHPPVIFLTGHANVASSVRAMKQGAVDYLTKPFKKDDLLAAVTTALQQHRDKCQAAFEKAELELRLMSLTNRERQVLPLVVSGFLNKQAAVLLGISEITLQIHRGRVMQKMKAKSLPGLVRISEKLGIPADDQTDRMQH